MASTAIVSTTKNMQQSNKFFWHDYRAPHYCWPASEESAGEAVVDEPSQHDTNDDEAPNCPKEGDHPAVTSAADAKGNDSILNEYSSFTIRSLKMGATGAVRTWPAAEVLLDYLVCRGGLREIQDKIIVCPATTENPSPSPRTLDLTGAPPEPYLPLLSSRPATGMMNIIELGSGSGYLGVGLALSLNREASLRSKNARHMAATGVRRQQKFEPKVRVMCTDNDRHTIKNMRHNIVNQSNVSNSSSNDNTMDRNVSKAVRVESLGWGDDIGGPVFSKAAGSFFQRRTSKKNAKERNESSEDTITETIEAPVPLSLKNGASMIEEGEKDDPIRRVTHLVASDVHFGETTLEPLSSVIAAFKLRHPQIIVVVLNRERSPGAVAALKEQIEAKVERGLLAVDSACSLAEEQRSSLKNFSVSVRDVLHTEIAKLKLVEC